MKIIDNVNSLLGDDLKGSLAKGSKLKIAASCFSIYAYEALKSELARIDGLEFIFTAPTFVPTEVTDKVSKERREFFIPKANRESNLYGSEFEIQLRNKLTQRAVARECADWIRKKAKFRSNKSKAPMQQFVCVTGATDDVAYMPLNGFTAVDLGYQRATPSPASSTGLTRLFTPEPTSSSSTRFGPTRRSSRMLRQRSATTSSPSTRRTRPNASTS
uniref:Helicase n=1 Tax=Phenylobacterium glaciei TaxID=2803784 RepID=A0A974P445_9CAUL|nr:hypothetical protein JKL49_00995 [Phenylobacterium glaciei]